MWLLEHWEQKDLDLWADGERARPLPEGVVLGHQGYRDADVRRLITENPSLRFHDYFTVWTYPDSTWINQGNVFFDYFYSLLSRHGLLWFDQTTGYPGIATYKDRMLARLDPTIPESQPASIAAVMLSASRGQGIFLDQYYPDGLDQWMAHDFGGKFLVGRLASISVEEHTHAMRNLVGYLAAKASVLTGGGSLHDQPGYGIAARYFEGTGTFAAHPWDVVLPAWKEESSNVLSVLAEDEPHVTRALDEWASWGGWLAFTTQVGGEQGEMIVRSAYDRARARREGATPPVPPSPTDTGSIAP